MTEAAPVPAGRLAGRIALLTGASRGIGRAVALRFAREGAQLVLVARTQAGLEELDDEIRAEGLLPPSLVPLDLRDAEKIDQVGAAIFQRWGRLDILVGNAGQLGTLTPMHQIRPKEWDEILAVNLTANWRLLRATDPLLRASPSGRVIFLSSGTTKGPRAYWAAYGVSKAALEWMALSYAAEVAKTAIRVNLIDPGGTRTHMRASAYPGEDPNSLKAPEEISGAFVDLAEAACARHGEVIRLAG